MAKTPTAPFMAQKQISLDVTRRSPYASIKHGLKSLHDWDLGSLELCCSVPDPLQPDELVKQDPSLKRWKERARQCKSQVMQSINPDVKDKNQLRTSLVSCAFPAPYPRSQNLMKEAHTHTVHQEYQLPKAKKRLSVWLLMSIKAN